MDKTYLDTSTWARRDAFEYFRAFDKPYFNVCVRLDAAPLKAAVKARGIGTFTLAYHFIALRLANQLEPLRYRLEAGRVRVLDVVHAAITVLRDDESFSFAYLDHDTDWARFARRSMDVVAQAQSRSAAFEPRVDEAGVIHFTTLPLVPFTSFSHARNWGREDSVPKLAFGRADRDGAHLWLPFSVEVHHALMDGLHVGRYVQAMEQAFADPAPWLAAER
jgi:chloramphenicol O-acetyltransferase type A